MTSPSPLPLFYRRIEAFDTARHGQLRRPASVDFSFAANTSVIPLLVTEVPYALRHYPLVFIPGEADTVPTLSAVVGLGDERNLFVDPTGAWLVGAHIPAYVRRYPFHAMRVESQADPLLAIDPDYAIDAAGEPLVDAAGEPSAYLAGMLDLAREYLVAADRTEAICRALRDAGVLEPGDITLQATAGQQHRIDGFLNVSEERLRALSAEAVTDLHRADAMGLAYAQVLSLANFRHLPLPTPPKRSASPRRKRA